MPVVFFLYGCSRRTCSSVQCSVSSSTYTKIFIVGNGLGDRQRDDYD